MPMFLQILTLFQNEIILRIYREIQASALVYEERISFHKKVIQKEFWIVRFSPLL